MPPRLQSLRQAAASSGPAALSLEFSRPMEPLLGGSRSSLNPPIPFSLQGQSNPCCCCRRQASGSMARWCWN